MNSNVKGTLRIIGVAFIALVIVAFVQTYLERSYRDNFLEGERMFKSKHYKHAFYYYDLVPKSDPRYTAAQQQRERCGRVLDSLKKLDKNTH